MTTISFPSLEVLGNDILYQICSILAEPISDSSFKPLYQYERIVNKKDLALFASTSRLVREIAKPILFGEIIIRYDWRAEGNWDIMATRVERLLSDNDRGNILQYVRRIFEFSLRLDRGDFTPTPFELPYQLASVLLHLSKVQTVNILIPEHQANVFAEALDDIKLPLVKKIFVGAYNEFFISLCPNVRTVWTERRFGEALGQRRGVDANLHAMLLINAVLKADSVQELKISQEWTVAMANALAAHPNSILLLSEISLSSNSSTKLPDLLIPLSSLSNLRTLELGSVSSLNVDFNPPLMRKVSRVVDRQMKRAQELVLRMLDEAPNGGQTRLKRVVIGDEEFRTSAIFEKKSDAEVGGGGGENGRRVGKWVGIKTAWDTRDERGREERNKRRERRRAFNAVDGRQKQVQREAREEEQRRQAAEAENRRMFELEENNRQRIAERKKGHK